MLQKKHFSNFWHCNLDIMHNPEKEILAFEIRQKEFGIGNEGLEVLFIRIMMVRSKSV